ncbi:MAG: hypothetical protein HY901_32075 [Deltaproteobacteria bacterium]|nr:hypothetical protein [Deltaproteobacteria bacterium]
MRLRGLLSPNAAGTCQRPHDYPIQCPPPNPSVDNRVCDCSGQTHWDRCHARIAHASIAHDGPCEE